VENVATTGGGVVVLDPAPIVFEVNNTSLEASEMAYEISITDADGAVSSNLHFAGLNVGERLAGTVTVPAGGSETVSAQVVALEHEPFERYEVQMLADLDGGGSMDVFAVRSLVTQPPEPSGIRCDADGDGTVDRADIALIVAARNMDAAEVDDVRDADGDGTITVMDARACVADCTLPKCARP
jgi:hypothetical protein